MACGTIEAFCTGEDRWTKSVWRINCSVSWNPSKWCLWRQWMHNEKHYHGIRTVRSGDTIIISEFINTSRQWYIREKSQFSWVTNSGFWGSKGSCLKRRVGHHYVLRKKKRPLSTDKATIVICAVCPRLLYESIDSIKLKLYQHSIVSFPSQIFRPRTVIGNRLSQ